MNQRTGVAGTGRRYAGRTLAVLLPLVLAFVLSACGLSTDTVATVGNEKITRGQLAATGATTPASQASALQNLIYVRMLDQEARAQKITVSAEEIAAQNQRDITDLQGTEGFVQTLLQQGAPGSGPYFQSVRQQILLEKMRPLWQTGTVTSITFQQITTDSLQKAQEAVQKGRAGTAFEELVKTYSLPTAQTPDKYTIPPISQSAIPGSIRSSFPNLNEGSYSEPIPNGPSTYVILRVAKVENRAPTAQDSQELILKWLESLRAKYPVTINDPTLQAAMGQ